MRFIDEVKLEIVAGDGGNGVVAFRRDRRNPRGGPSGGDGGRGGDVVFRGNRNLGTLLDLKAHPRIRAKRGQDGGGNDCNGKSAAPTVIDVPLGTAVVDMDTNALIGDITEHDALLVVAEGGQGGLGNLHFATSSNRAPRYAQPGQPGEIRTVKLELKLLADVGLVGLPNAGKSTLISAISAARPKIADYPFTTLVPNLGVVSINPDLSYVVADIPGLIRGAADGAGLGSRFLKHIQRTATLLYVLAPDEDETSDIADDFDDLRAEVEKFDPALIQRPQVAVLNKIDLPAATEVIPTLEAFFEVRGIPFFAISAATHHGLEPLKKALAEIVAENRVDAEIVADAADDLGTAKEEVPVD